MNGKCDSCDKPCDHTTGGIVIREFHGEERKTLAVVCNRECLIDWTLREYTMAPPAEVAR